MWQQDKQEVGVGTLVLTRLRQYKVVLTGVGWGESVGPVWAWPPDRNSTTWSCSWRASGSTATAPTSATAATWVDRHHPLFDCRCVPLTCRTPSTETGRAERRRWSPGPQVLTGQPELVNVLHQSESIKVKVNQQLQSLCWKTEPGMTWWVESTPGPISHRGKALRGRFLKKGTQQ